MAEFTREQLENQKVDELRAYARSIGINGNAVNYMSKNGLIEAILEKQAGNSSYNPERGTGNTGGTGSDPTGEPTGGDPEEQDPDEEEGEPEGSGQMSLGFSPPHPPQQDPLAKVIAEAVKQYLTTGADPEMIAALAQQLEGRITASEEALNGRIEEAIKKAKTRVRPIRIEYTAPEIPPIDLGLQHFMFEEVLKDVLALPPSHRNFALVGPAGSGKNVIVESVAKAINLPFETTPVGLNTSKADLMGFMHAGGGYVSTPLRKCYEQGGVFLLDELDSGNPNVLTCINALLANEHGGFPDGLVARHKDFVFFAAANTFGLGADCIYVGRLQLDGATRDRFDFLEIPYDEKLEEAIAPNAEWFQKILKLRRAAEKLKEKVIISPRATIKGGYLKNAGIDEKKILDRVVFRGVSAEVRKRIEAQAA